MLNSLNTGVSGMQGAQDRMNVIGDNIANVNTTGFKASRATFEDSFSQTLRSAVSGSSASGGTSSIQVGAGVHTAGTSMLFTRGQVTTTEVPTDLYVAGEGYFSVKDAAGQAFVTRAGDFHIDSSTGYLMTNNGQIVQGYTDNSKSQVGNLVVDKTGSTSGTTISAVKFQPNGEIEVVMDNGSKFIRGQVLLQTVRNPQALTREGNNLFGNLTAAGVSDPAIPNTSGTGPVQAGALELSNVNLANEFANLISSQRAFQANARIITTSDELLQEMVNLKR